MRTINRLLVIFAVAFAFFFIAPAFLSSPFPLYPLLTMGDILDVFTPLVLMPLYYLIFRAIRKSENPVNHSILFVILSAIWVEGQGMHLAANAIGHQLKEFTTTEAYQLTYFIDEQLSHHIWHIGIIGLALFLFFIQWKEPFRDTWHPSAAAIFAALLHGLTLFLIFVEGQTCHLGAFLCAAILIITTGFGRKKVRSEPVIFFLYLASGITLILIALWIIYWGGTCPEFSVLLDF